MTGGSSKPPSWKQKSEIWTHEDAFPQVQVWRHSQDKFPGRHPHFHSWLHLWRVRISNRPHERIPSALGSRNSSPSDCDRSGSTKLAVGSKAGHFLTQSPRPGAAARACCCPLPPTLHIPTLVEVRTLRRPRRRRRQTLPGIVFPLAPTCGLTPRNPSRCANFRTKLLPSHALHPVMRQNTRAASVSIPPCWAESMGTDLQRMPRRPTHARRPSASTSEGPDSNSGC